MRLRPTRTVRSGIIAGFPIPHILPPMELAKSFEPADIERRWYPDWEAKGYFNAGLDTQNPNAFCILLPPPNVTGTLHMGHGFNQAIMDTMTRHRRMCGDNTLVAAGNGPRRHRDADRRRTPTRRARCLAPRPRPREVRRESVGVEGILGQHHHPPDAPSRHLAGLDARTLHDGRRPLEDRHRDLRPPAQGRPDLPRQAPRKLGPGAAHGRFRPRSGKRGRRRFHVAHPLPAGRWLGLADRCNDPPGNNARRHRRDGAPGGRALQAPDRQAWSSCR